MRRAIVFRRKPAPQREREEEGESKIVDPPLTIEVSMHSIQNPASKADNEHNSLVGAFEQVIADYYESLNEARMREPRPIYPINHRQYDDEGNLIGTKSEKKPSLSKHARREQRKLRRRRQEQRLLANMQRQFQVETERRKIAEESKEKAREALNGRQPVAMNFDF